MASAQEQGETVQRGEGQLSAPHQGLSAFFRAVGHSSTLNAWSSRPTMTLIMPWSCFIMHYEAAGSS